MVQEGLFAALPTAETGQDDLCVMIYNSFIGITLSIHTISKLLASTLSSFSRSLDCAVDSACHAQDPPTRNCREGHS